MSRPCFRAAAVAALACLATAQPVSAGPWTPRAGHGEMIFTATVYRTPAPFDAHGDREPFDYDGRYTKREVNPYFQVGLTDRVALFGNLFASRQQFTNSFGRLSNSGVGDTEVGARYRLTGDGAGLVVAVQGLVKLPTSRSGGAIRLADGQTDLESRVALGGSIGGGPRPAFWNVDAGYRYRNGSPADEIRMDAGAGTHLSRRVMLLAQFAGITGLRNGNPDAFDARGNPTIGPDYDLYRVQLSTVITVVDGIRLQGGGFVHAAGRNTGAGGGALLSAWVGF